MLEKRKVRGTEEREVERWKEKRNEKSGKDGKKDDHKVEGKGS